MIFSSLAAYMVLAEDFGPRGFLLAILPPGAFIGLGLLIAIMNVINARRAERAARVAVAAPRPAGA